MAILNIVTDKPGNVGVKPRRVEILSTDNRATVIAAGYLSNSPYNQVNAILPTDIVDMTYSYNPSTGVGTYEEFTPSFNGGVITLVPFVDPGNVLLPVVNNDFANFNGTSGQIKDSGYSPTNAAKTKVVMADAATVVNHVMVSTDVTGTSGNLAGTAINDGSLQAGRDTVAGSLISYPATTGSGFLEIKATNSASNRTTSITNAAMGQSTAFVIPDPGIATTGVAVFGGNITVGHTVKVSTAAGVLIDNGVGFFGGLTDTWGGGATTHDFTATGAVVGMNPTATLATSTSATATVVRASVPSANVLRVVFTADPGANTSVNWNASFI